MNVKCVSKKLFSLSKSTPQRECFIEKEKSTVTLHGSITCQLDVERVKRRTLGRSKRKAPEMRAAKSSEFGEEE